MKAFVMSALLGACCLAYLWTAWSPQRCLIAAEGHKAAAWSGKLEFYTGMYCYMRNDYETAVAAFSQLLKNHGDSASAPDAMFYLGMSYKELNQRDKALAEFARLLEKYPGHEKASLARRNQDFLK